MKTNLFSFKCEIFALFLQSELNEQKLEKAKKEMTGCQKFGMYFTRIIINLFVLAVIGASFYLIYYVTEESAKVK